MATAASVAPRQPLTSTRRGKLGVVRPAGTITSERSGWLPRSIGSNRPSFTNTSRTGHIDRIRKEYGEGYVDMTDYEEEWDYWTNPPVGSAEWYEFVMEHTTGDEQYEAVKNYVKAMDGE